ncbi:MAG: methylated-DNA--[protein]-cysteine S-methyltransferase [Desulfobacteraceae bacterium]|nr:MAG: methylated-DNA--[protein]-cysteine S-methyltransferase [Desulfobacteraceae bacterium]
MAGTTVPEIYCWNIKIEDLNIYLASSKRGALRVGLSLREKRDSATFFRKRFPNTRLVENYPLNKLLVQAVQAALLNKPFRSTVDFDFSCTPFQWQVLKTIARIPFGETRTYGDVASMVGKPKGARAIGQVMRKNPMPLIFP